MKTRSLLITCASLALAASAVTPAVGGAAAGSGTTRQIVSVGTTSLRSAQVGSGALQNPEFPRGIGPEASTATGPGRHSGLVNRSKARERGITSSGGAPATALAVASSSSLLLSFDGLNHRDQRTANGGNQWSLEPPDQGLCAGNGFVMESVNDVLRVFDTSGNPLTGVIDLNTFYGYIAAINRTTGVQGPFVTDPSCYYDPDTQRWFNVVLTLDVFPDGSYKGTNHLDIAVSKSANPTGKWTIYRLPVQDDGSDGTPNHGCSTGPFNQPTPPTNPNACFGDYPHIGADANGFYVTTNEYDFFGPNFRAAQVYAFSKRAFAGNLSKVSVTQFDTLGAVNGTAGFTVWPAISPASIYETAAGGTEYFLSSDGGGEVNPSGAPSRDLIIWAITNTSSLTSSPALRLSNRVLALSTAYSIPPLSVQKAGNIPLADCLNDQSLRTPYGVGCWRYFFTKNPKNGEVESTPDSNDTRMQQVMFAAGKVWGALDTAVSVGGRNQAGIQWFAVTPSVSSSGVGGTIAAQGVVAGPAGTNITYPAIGMTPSGIGVMAFSLMGVSDYPSAAFAPISAAGVGPISIARAGLGPTDGFTSYKAFVGNPPRTRWGDYGAAAVNGSSVWIASEYIGQTCTYEQFVNATASPQFTCGKTRTALGNWDTRISQVTP